MIFLLHYISNYLSIHLQIFSLIVFSLWLILSHLTVFSVILILCVWSFVIKSPLKHSPIFSTLVRSLLPANRTLRSLQLADTVNVIGVSTGSGEAEWSWAVNGLQTYGTDIIIPLPLHFFINKNLRLFVCISLLDKVIWICIDVNTLLMNGNDWCSTGCNVGSCM